MESHKRFDRGMQEASSSKASNLQRLMERETENIRQWKVESERKLEEQQQEIQGKANIIARLQKQLCSTQVEKDEALGLLRENDDKCQELLGRFDKFAAKYQRILTGVTEKEKEERSMKEQHQILMEDKDRLKSELDQLTESFRGLQMHFESKLEEARVENERIASQLGSEIRCRSELSAELAATKESQLLLVAEKVQKVSFLEEEMGKKSDALTRLLREKDGLVLAHGKEKESLQMSIKEGEITVVKLERDLVDREREFKELKEKGQGESKDWEEKCTALANRTNELNEMLGEQVRCVQDLRKEIQRIKDENQSLLAARRDLDAKCRSLTDELGESRQEAEKLEAVVAENLDLVQRLQTSLDEGKRTTAKLEETVKDLDDKASLAETEILELQDDAKKYEAEILFRQETLHQKEAEYASMSEKLKELSVEKDSTEKKLVETAASLDVEREARIEEEEGRVAALADVDRLRGELYKAREQIDMSKGALEKVIHEKSTYESNCVQLEMSNQSLENELAASQARVKTLQEGNQATEGKLKSDSAAWEDEKKRLAAEVKITEKNAEEYRSDKEKYEKVIEDLVAKHQEASKMTDEQKFKCNDLTLQILDANQAKDQQAKEHAKTLDDIKKDREDLASFQKSNIARFVSQVDNLNKRIAKKDQQLAALEEEKQKRIEENDVESTKTSTEMLAQQQQLEEEHARQIGALEAKIREMEATSRQQLERESAGKGDEETALVKQKEQLESTHRDVEKASEEKIRGLYKEITDMKLNLGLKDSECQGLKERIVQIEEDAAAMAAATTNQESVVPFTPVASSTFQLAANQVKATPSKFASFSSTPSRCEDVPLSSQSTAAPPQPPKYGPGICTPIKLSKEVAQLNSPAIKRSIGSSSMKIDSKKSKVTFGGSTSRFISASEDDNEGAESFSSRIELGKKTPDVRRPRTLSAPSPKVDTTSTAAPMEPNVGTAVRSIPRKFLELKATNDAKKEAKRKLDEARKEKYPNKFMELKAKNEERKKAKEALKEASKKAEDSASDCDWF